MLAIDVFLNKKWCFVLLSLIDIIEEGLILLLGILVKMIFFFVEEYWA